VTSWSVWNRAVAAEARRLGLYDLVVHQRWADLDRSLSPERAVLALLLDDLHSSAPKVESKKAKSGRRSRVARASQSNGRFSPTGRVLRAWQAEALAAWERAGRIGVVEAVTGTGKTQVGIEAAAGQLALGGKALIVVPTVALLDQWLTSFQREYPSGRVGLRGGGHSTSFAESDVIVTTIQSAHTLPAPADGLLVADECHRYGGEKWFTSLDPRYSARLGLSATYERGDDGDERLAALFGSEPVYHIGYERAIADDIVARFRLAFVGVPLDVDERFEYNEASKASRTAFGRLVHTFGLEPEPFAGFMRQVAVARDGEWGSDPAGARKAAISYTHNFQKQRNIVAESRSKASRLRDLLPVAERAAGTLVFTQTKQAAVDAAELFDSVGAGAAAVYGGMRPGDREKVLESFGTGGKSVLAAPRVLDEGIDVPEADLGIVVSASNSKRQMIQRMGRVLRRKPDGRPARFVILFAEDTFEDPNSGIHEAFIDIALDHADECGRFGSRSPARKLQRFLDAN